jgi:hypothetical protein
METCAVAVAHCSYQGVSVEAQQGKYMHRLDLLIFTPFVAFVCPFENTGQRDRCHFQQSPSLRHSSMECWNPG